MPFALRTLAILALIGTAFAIATPGLAQTSDAIVLPVDWKVGDKHRIEIAKEKERIRGGARKSSGQAVTTVDIEVLRKLDDGYIVRWTYGKTRFAGAAANPLAQKLVNIAENLNLDMRTDARGSIVALENGDRIRAHYRAAGIKMLQWMKEAGLPDSTVGQLAAVLRKMSESDAIEQSALREPSLFYLAFGGSYRRGAPLAFEDKVANPWGQEPIPTKATLSLKQLDRKSGTATIGWKQAFDRNKAGPILQKSMAALGLPAAKGDRVFSGLALNDDALFIFDTATGWLLSGSWQRSTTINGTLAGIERLKYNTMR